MKIPENTKFTVGFKYKNFKVVTSTPIPELRVHLFELVHEPSGAQVMHLEADDQENLFSLSFRTLPQSSNGVAHILEHTVLCGSKKYPVRDPFFAMNRRSLNTFMNALTGQDFTCYPAASQVEKDFYNLLEVYLDAVFHPNLDRLSFLQEGHRFEFANPTDPKSNLEIKGIVYNEMKGSLSSPMNRLMEAVGATIFPDVPYGCNSGGDPKEIPTLTHKELLEFHKEHYHPSRCLFFFYGNIPLAQHLTFIEEKALEGISPLPKENPLPRQKRFLKPKSHELVYPIAPHELKEDSCYVSFAWLTCHSLDHLTCLGLAILESILMETDASKLKLPLLQSGLCKQAVSTSDFELPDVPFMLTMIGCNKENVQKLEECIFNTLTKIVKEGIDHKLSDVALHLLELSRSEITGNGSPYGLSLFWRSGIVKQHGGNPLHGLEIQTLCSRFRAKLAEEPRFLERLIEQYFLNNPHFVRVLMRPDPGCAAKEAEEDTRHLQTIQKNLTEKETSQIIQDACALIQRQEDKQANSDCLPSISLDDAPKKSRNLILNRTQVEDKDVFTHSVFTNHIGYLDIARPLPKIDPDQLWLVRLFSYLLPQLGSGNRSYQENLGLIQENTGGLSVALSLNVQTISPNEYQPTFHLRGKALKPKLPKLASLLFDTCVEPNFTERKRIKELILKHASSLDSTFNSSALRYSLSFGASSFTAPLHLSEVWYGYSYYQKIQELAKHFDSKEEWLLQSLQKLSSEILSAPAIELLYTADEEMIATAFENQFWGLLDLPSRAMHTWDFSMPKSARESSARIISSPVAFSSLILPSIPYGSPQAPFLTLSTQILENTYLHTQIREKGGAYGAGASYNSMSAIFSFFSYRDPHIVATKQAFITSVDRIASGDFDDEDLEEAKREVIQGLDAPIAPGSRGEVAYGWWKEGKTLEMRQAFRSKILKATTADIQKAVQSQLLPQLSEGVFTTFAGEDLIENENRKLPIPLPYKS